MAIEPVPHNTKLLRRNVALNNYKHVQVYQLAIGAACGDAQMSITPESNFCNLLSEIDEALASDVRQILVAGTSDDRITVFTETLDNFLQRERISTIDFIRMDIEGFEIEATKGMRTNF